MNKLKQVAKSSLLAIALLIIASNYGCKKEKDVTDLEDFQSTSQDISQAESIGSDVDNMTSQVARTGTFDQSNPTDANHDQFNFLSCATVTHDSINHVITYDFHSGCTGADGKVRAGKVIVNYTGTGHFDPGSSWVVTFDSFYVNTRHVEGTRSVVNNGFNSDSNMNWTITATNMRITRADGSWRTWNSVRNREMVAGYGDNDWQNDDYLINGTADGTNSNGDAVNCVLTDLRREHDCHWITSGTLQITPASRPVRTIDFGTGTCDDQATVTKNGVSRTITLRP
ncbi:MAG: hypothetical protein IPI10_11805 [Bacteroidetes bacterium]|nr:hypothetical protein [Bacteroidota bacterium]